MNFVRELVSQKKSRYVHDEYNLDLTYITPRLIAMAYPAEGIESMFRNRIIDVARFLDSRHENHYLIVNASNRSYDYQKFQNRVISLIWPNHYPCPFARFASALADIFLYLSQNIKNVVVVHCLAGKGRTGSLVNAILFASGQSKTIEDANKFYYSQRQVNVTYPSQMRYLYYYENFFVHGLKNFRFKPVCVESVVIATKSLDYFVDKFFHVEFLDFAHNELLLAEAIIDGNGAEEGPSLDDKNTSSACLKVPFKSWSSNEASDILFTIKERGLIKSTKLMRLNFSTLMLNEAPLVWQFQDLDKPKNIPEDIQITIKFKDIDDPKIEEARLAHFSDIQKRTQLIRDLLKEENFGHLLIFGNEEKQVIQPVPDGI